MMTIRRSPDDDDEKLMPFLDHLDELRTCLIRALIGIALGTVVGYLFAEPTLDFLTSPLKRKILPPGLVRTLAPQPLPPLRIAVGDDGTLRAENWDQWRAAAAAPGRPGSDDDLQVRLVLPPPAGEPPDAPRREIALTPERSATHLIYLNPVTPFTLKLKTALLLGVVLSLPWTLWQAWVFVKPGLRRIERAYVSRIIMTAMVLFPLGAAFAYWTVPFTLAFFDTFRFGGLEPQLEVGKYLGLVLTMMLAMGAVFELPLVMLFLVKVGLVTTAQLRQYRRQAIVLIMIVSAVFTPPDVFTMIVMAVPLIILYEGSLIVCDLLVPVR
ncbi:MAG: hypothetical protein Kow0059_19190 [Candidatus Sumerlaeia bacterium]